jgi:predicted transcriptional regulator of viral defense system
MHEATGVVTWSAYNINRSQGSERTRAQAPERFRSFRARGNHRRRCVAAKPLSRATANQVLARLHRKRWLKRIRRGVYSVVPLASSTSDPVTEDAWPLAMKLFAPCFISGWSAAEHWDLTEQIYNAIAVVTTRPQRHAEQTLGGVSFRTRAIPERRFFGQKRIWFGSQHVDVADPHRLVIDILDDPSFGGGGRQTIDVVRAYWKSKHADADLLLRYAQRYGRGTVFKRLGFIAEQFGRVNSAWIESCRKGMTSGISSLDPGGPAKGRIASRWSLRINMPVDEL